MDKQSNTNFDQRTNLENQWGVDGKQNVMYTNVCGCAFQVMNDQQTSSLIVPRRKRLKFGCLSPDGADITRSVLRNIANIG